MKLGLLSDIHADARALQHALDLLEAKGAETFLCAGDLVDFGPHPDEMLTLLRERDVACVRGNHDRKIFLRAPKKFKKRHSKPGDIAPENMDFLRALPYSFSQIYDGLALAMYHASPLDDMALVHPRKHSEAVLEAMLRHAEADILVLGHTHLPIYVETPAGLVINPGAALVDCSAGHVSSSETCATFDVKTREYRLFDVKTGRRYSRTTWPWWSDVFGWLGFRFGGKNRFAEGKP